VDIRLSINAASPAQMAIARETGCTQTSSLELRERVTEARKLAAKRLLGTPWTLNAHVPGAYLRKNLPLSAESLVKLETALTRGLISMRGFDRCLRLAWSNADLAGRDTPNQFDVAKAIYLRGPEDLLAKEKSKIGSPNE
jgi:magnesium chelatase family protein